MINSVRKEGAAWKGFLIDQNEGRESLSEEIIIRLVTEGGVGDGPGKDVDQKHGRQGENDGEKGWGRRREKGELSGCVGIVRLDLVSKMEGDKGCNGRCV